MGLRRTLPCALAMLAAAAAPARAQPDFAERLADEVRVTLDAASSAWTARQGPGGLLHDALHGRASTAYGNAMIGYAQLRSAQRTGNAELREAGLRALGGGLRHWGPNGFELWTAQAALRRADGLQAELASALAAQLGTFSEIAVSPVARPCAVNPSCYSNLKLLDAVTTLGALASGVAAQHHRARLADPGRALRRARRMIERRVPRVVDGALTARSDTGRLRGSTLSDPSRNPLAYVAFSAWLMLRGLDELGPAADPDAEEVAADVLDAIAALAAPDGDMSYLGRGQGQVWVPAVMVAAGVEGARRFADDPVRARRYLGIAATGWARLRERHDTGGILRLVEGSRTDMAGIDDYAGEVTYNGMALFALQHALDALEAGVPTLRPLVLPAAAGDAVAVDDDATGLATVRRGDVWFAVHERQTHPRDLRSDFGLLSLKVRDGGEASWRDLLAPRPLTERRRDRALGAGPLLVAGAAVHHPYGDEIAVTARGTVVVRGRWITLGGVLLRRGVLARFRPLRDGVRVSVPARPGERFRVATFAAPGTWELRDDRVLAGAAEITVDALATRRVTRGLHSGPVRDLDRIATTSAPMLGRRFTVTLRAR